MFRWFVYKQGSWPMFFWNSLLISAGEKDLKVWEGSQLIMRNLGMSIGKKNHQMLHSFSKGKERKRFSWGTDKSYCEIKILQPDPILLSSGCRSVVENLFCTQQVQVLPLGVSRNSRERVLPETWSWSEPNSPVTQAEWFWSKIVSEILVSHSHGVAKGDAGEAIAPGNKLGGTTSWQQAEHDPSGQNCIWMQPYIIGKVI